MAHVDCIMTHINSLFNWQGSITVSGVIKMVTLNLKNNQGAIEIFICVQWKCFHLKQIYKAHHHKTMKWFAGTLAKLTVKR